MTKIFISYNHKNGASVEALTKDIEELGHTVWFDKELSGGQTWWDQILTTIRDADVFIFALSPEALRSTPCEREYGYAAKLGKPILPVLVADGIRLNLLPPELSRIQHVDYRKTQDRDSAIRLSRALTSVPIAKQQPDPLPTPPEVPISYLATLSARVNIPSSLSSDEQSILLVELKEELRKSENIDDVYKLLEDLKNRPELLAKIDKQINELLRTRKQGWNNLQILGGASQVSDRLFGKVKDGFSDTRSKLKEPPEGLVSTTSRTTINDTTQKASENESKQPSTQESKDSSSSRKTVIIIVLSIITVLLALRVLSQFFID